MHKFPFLTSINSPSDLRDLEQDKLHIVARELREFILDSVSKTGGHLASNLGSIELTVALHYVYNTPDDLIVWDVGHQSYAHKILTGRMNQMDSLRQYEGLSGFPSRSESIYDTFGVGHSSTSISGALGMAVANKRLGSNNKAIAVIGDGSMTSGLAFEGLNNAGWLDTDILVILNDNEMSISENVGSIRNYLSSILAGRFYNSIKQTANKAFSLVPGMQKFAHKMEEHIKGMVLPSTMFEELGFNYIGPIDGHDVEALTETLKKIKKLSGPQFLHIVTTKGYGYKLAENNPIGYHGVSNFDKDKGIDITNNVPKNPTYTQIFGMWINDAAHIHEDFVAITPAMREGSGLVEFAQNFPDRFFDVGIAEQHAVTFASGIATTKVKAIVAIYSTFLQRGYDQIIHDVALQNLPVMFALDRAGIVGADGPTHTGTFDIAFLRCIPNLVIMMPSNGSECYEMLWLAYYSNSPCIVRYPRGACNDIVQKNNKPSITLGTGNIVRQATNCKVAILSFGTMIDVALRVANTIDATVCNMRFVKPLDVELLKKMAIEYDYIVTIEEGVIHGGAGSFCIEVLLKLALVKPVLTLGMTDNFPPHGDTQAVLKLYHLDYDGILESIKNFMDKHDESAAIKA